MFPKSFNWRALNSVWNSWKGGAVVKEESRGSGGGPYEIGGGGEVDETWILILILIKGWGNWSWKRRQPRFGCLSSTFALAHTGKTWTSPRFKQCPSVYVFNAIRCLNTQTQHQHNRRYISLPKPKSTNIVHHKAEAPNRFHILAHPAQDVLFSERREDATTSDRKTCYIQTYYCAYLEWTVLEQGSFTQS